MKYYFTNYLPNSTIFDSKNSFSEKILYLYSINANPTLIILVYASGMAELI